MVESSVAWLVGMVDNIGYWGILILMVVESSLIPFPSEVVMIPVGYLSYVGKLNFFLSILVGIIGSLIGACINYALAYYLGRPFIERFGQYIFISKKSFDRACSFFVRYGEIATFLGRLLPAIRQLISLPAGLASMSFSRFIFYTVLGAGIWVTILALIGYYLGNNEALLRQYVSRINVSFVITTLFVIVCLYVYRKKTMQQKKDRSHIIQA